MKVESSIIKQIAIWFLVLLLVSCNGSNNKDLTKSDTDKIAIILNKHNDIKYLDLNYSDKQFFLINNEEFSTDDEVKLKYKFSQKEWTLLKNELVRYAISSIVRVDSEFLFITDSFKYDFIGFLRTNRKVKQIVIDTDFIVYDKFVIKSAEEIENNWYKVDVSW